MYTSEFVLKEVYEKLLRKIKLTADETAIIIHFLHLNCRIVPETKLTQHVSRDRDDDHVLAAALTVESDCIITGDEDLLILKSFHDIPIVKPANFWKIEILQDSI